MVRVGIVGMGFMGRAHFGCYQQLPNARVVAIADINPKRAAGDVSDVRGNIADAANAQLRMDGILPMTDYRDLMKTDVDVVDVCVPTPAHPEIAIAAMRAGKHVLCEKPLARTSELGRPVLNAARLARGFFMPAMCMRFWPEWSWLKETVAQRRYGNLLSVSLTRLASRPRTAWFSRGEESGGAILDLHIHDTDIICWLLGLPKAVSSCGYVGDSGEVDHLLTQYRYDDVALVTAEGSWSLHDGLGFRMRYVANFEQATADYDSARSDTLIVYQDRNATPIACAKSDGWAEEIRYFVGCVQSGSKPTMVTVDDAMNALRVIEAERQSIAKGAAVQL